MLLFYKRFCAGGDGGPGLPIVVNSAPRRDAQKLKTRALAERCCIQASGRLAYQQACSPEGVAVSRPVLTGATLVVAGTVLTMLECSPLRRAEGLGLVLVD